MAATEQRANETLAHKLGEVAHVSPLLRKAIRVSGCAEDIVGQWLLKCATLRGANHYAREFDAGLPPDNRQLSDEEVGVALCLGELTYDSAFIRAAAQLLSSSQTDANRLARLAVQERAEPVLLHIAEAAFRFVPDAQPWADPPTPSKPAKTTPSQCAAALVALRKPDRRYSFRRRAGCEVAVPWQIQIVSNPLRILKTVDNHLTSPAEITLFGRAALALGYPHAPDYFHNTHDVDGILPMAWLEPPDAQDDFWQAVQRTKAELEPDGLYLTHLFREIDVIRQGCLVEASNLLSFSLRSLRSLREAQLYNWWGKRS